MKINNQVLSIPPHISTSWKNIDSILMDAEENLIIILNNNTKISIPNLEKSIINVIFDAHSKYVEQSPKEQSQKVNSSFSMGLPIKIGAEGLESLGSAMQHNSANSDAPDLPKEILNKITSISKIMGAENPDMIPKAEPHCNCVHCQIARAMRGEEKEINSPEVNQLEEEVSEEDLKFRTWDINQTDTQLYIVSNPIDPNEKYNVFLGKPIGCTCGQQNCEHIRAVLNS